MELLLLGLTFGVLTVMMPGPISMSLVQVAAIQGRAAGGWAGLGIAGGDVLLSVAAVAAVSGGSALPGGMFALLQFASSGVLVVLGLTLLLRPAGVQAQAQAVTRPGRTFLVLTTFMPSTFGSWVAVLAAMPFAHDRPSLVIFAAGIVAASALWHPTLGFGAAVIAERLTPRFMTVATRLGGIATIAVGVWALL